MQIHVTYNGEQFELPSAGIADMVAFERHFGLSASALAPEEGEEQNARLEYMCFLAYRGLRKLGALPPGEGGKAIPFGDEFLDGIDDFEVIDEDDDEAGDEAPDPTVPAQVTG